MKAREIQNKPVISINDGVKVGRVADVLFSLESLRLAALVVDTGNGRSILPYDSVHSVGRDAVTINSTAEARDAALTSQSNLRGFGDIKGLAVASADGTYLGDVREAEIDPADGRLLELTTRRGGFLGLGGRSTVVKASEVRGIGEKLITVEMSVEPAEPVEPAEQTPSP